MYKISANTDYACVRKYFEVHSELEYLANIIDEKFFVKMKKKNFFANVRVE